MSKLIMMMGCPGAGKSTWAKEHVTIFDDYISRDEIRFALVSPNEEYFSKEDEVWKSFIRQIDMALKRGGTVWADATHLSMRSRLKLLNALKVKPDEIEIVYINAPLETALRQNEMREGTRAYVPPKSIENMWRAIQEPEFHEGQYTYKTIYIVEPNKPIEIKKEA